MHDPEEIKRQIEYLESGLKVFSNWLEHDSENLALQWTFDVTKARIHTLERALENFLPKSKKP